jgi:hypothetical protein
MTVLAGVDLSAELAIVILGADGLVPALTAVTVA